MRHLVIHEIFKLFCKCTLLPFRKQLLQWCKLFILFGEKTAPCVLSQLRKVWCSAMGVRRGGRGGKHHPGFWNYLQKKVVFSISSGKKQISPLLAHPGKSFGKIPYCPPLEKILPTPMCSVRCAVCHVFWFCLLFFLVYIYFLQTKLQSIFFSTSSIIS